MEKIFFGILALASLSVFADDCTVSIRGLEINTKNAIRTLEAKGYAVIDSSPKYSIEGANYLGPRGEKIKVVNMFERGVDNRIAHIEQNFSFFKGFKKIERSFLSSLPSCN